MGKQNEVRKLATTLEFPKDLADGVTQLCRVHFVYLKNYYAELPHTLEIATRMPQEIPSIMLNGFKSTKPATYEFMDNCLENRKLPPTLPVLARLRQAQKDDPLLEDVGLCRLAGVPKAVLEEFFSGLADDELASLVADTHDYGGVVHGTGTNLHYRIFLGHLNPESRREKAQGKKKTNKKLLLLTEDPKYTVLPFIFLLGSRRVIVQYGYNVYFSMEHIMQMLLFGSTSDLDSIEIPDVGSKTKASEMVARSTEHLSRHEVSNQHIARCLATILGSIRWTSYDTWILRMGLFRLVWMYCAGSGSRLCL